MAAHPLDLEANAVEDLTAVEGDLSLWIGQKKTYHDMPTYVSNELCQCTSVLPSAMAHLPSESLPVLQLLEVTTPQVTESFQNIKPDDLFMFYEATHTSSECFQLPAPSGAFLNQLCACAGQAMLDGKTSIQHWDKRYTFLPFDTLGTWAQILKIDAAKKAWFGAIQWMMGCPKIIPGKYVTCIMLLLCQVPWSEYIKGLGSALTIKDMASFLS
jgi:hypothetical protein